MNCDDCRNWSEMLAQCIDGSGSVEAMCLASKGPNKGKYVKGYMRCDSFRPGRKESGAIDDPGYLAAQE